MPSLFPISLLRSSEVPCKSLGYHARGTEIERLSFKSIVRLLSVITMLVIGMSTALQPAICKRRGDRKQKQWSSSVLIVDSIKDAIVNHSDSPFRSVHEFCLHPKDVG